MAITEQKVGYEECDFSEDDEAAADAARADIIAEKTLGNAALKPRNSLGLEPSPVTPNHAFGTFDQLARTLIELEKEFPPPKEGEILSDCRWFQDCIGSSILAEYRGTHVAIYQGEVVGSGDNSLQLNITLSRKLGVHPQRLVIEYIPRPSVF